MAIVIAYSLINQDTKEDGQFKANLFVCEMTLKPIRQELQDASQNYDINSFEYWCVQLKTTAKICKDLMTSEELGGIDVSPKYSSARTEYIAYLDDVYYAGYYGEQGNLDLFMAYYEDANAHMNKTNLS